MAYIVWGLTGRWTAECTFGLVLSVIGAFCLYLAVELAPFTISFNQAVGP